eukprot:Colp12_sorted_trinity150504_noHs@23536
MLGSPRNVLLSQAGTQMSNGSVKSVELTTVDDLARDLIDKACLMNEDGKLIVAIVGVPGAGKSTLVSQLSEIINQEHPDSCAVIPMDGFHLTREELNSLPDPVEAHKRRGAPWTFNPHGLIDTLKRLQHYGTVKAPAFDHAARDPVSDVIHVKEFHKVILVEGNYLLLPSEPWTKLKSFFNVTYFLHTDPEIAAQRLLKRHIAAWPEKSAEEIQAHIEYNDLPNAELVLSTQALADHVIRLTER